MQIEWLFINNIALLQEGKPCSRMLKGKHTSARGQRQHMWRGWQCWPRLTPRGRPHRMTRGPPQLPRAARGPSLGPAPQRFCAARPAARLGRRQSWGGWGSELHGRIKKAAWAGEKLWVASPAALVVPPMDTDKPQKGQKFGMCWHRSLSSLGEVSILSQDGNCLPHRHWALISLHECQTQKGALFCGRERVIRCFAFSMQWFWSAFSGSRHNTSPSPQHRHIQESPSWRHQPPFPARCPPCSLHKCWDVPAFFLSGAGGKWFKEASGKTSPGFAQSMGLGERAAAPWAHRRCAPLPTLLETPGAFEPPLSSLHNHYLSSSSSWT